MHRDFMISLNLKKAIESNEKSWIFLKKKIPLRDKLSRSIMIMKEAVKCWCAIQIILQKFH